MNRRLSFKRCALVIALAASVGVSLTLIWGGSRLNAAPTPKPPAGTSTSGQNQTAASAQQPQAAPKAALPEEGSFRLAAESANLKLWVDTATAHFKVENKTSGQIWRSYPDPEQWPSETITGTWRNNLLSPIMLEYIDTANFKSQSKLISWLEDKGQLEGFQTTADGFKVTFHFTGTQFKIPVEVKLKDDYVETKIIDSGIKEGKLSLLNVKLYALFGAEPSIGQDGYLLVPDGSGALVRFKQNITNDKSVYRESIYGTDYAFFAERTSRNYVKMPVFGLKSGNQAFVGVLTGGEEYAKLFASPGGAFGQFNWITPEWQYRIKFYQKTSKKKNTGFFTYSKERFTAPERAVRYYLLDPSKSDYVGMASKYREYLVKDKGLKPLKPSNGNVPFFLDIIGADVKKGLFWDKYLKGTTTQEATDMIRRLRGLGIENIRAFYTGWQKGGYSSIGGYFPVDSRLGGNEGMKQFIQSAHSLNIPVYLKADYSLNNNGGDGFKSEYDGLRNLAGTVLSFENYNNQDTITLTSPKFAAKTVHNDLSDYKALGADGIFFEGIGKYLNSDFNERYRETRTEVLQSQRGILKEAKETLGEAIVEKGNFYTLDQVSHIQRLYDDYSYDLFVDEPVPFAQIAIHGLITYTSDWSNLRDQYQLEFLRSIEFGAYPTYVFTNAPSGDMKGAYSIYYYSLNYRDWEEKASKEYQRYNQALGDVQDKPIIGHRQLAPNVKETIYEGGKTIIVNYNAEAYSNGGIQVPAKDFIVISGEKTP